MILLTKENIDSIVNSKIDMIRAVAYKYLYRFDGLYLFDIYDPINETYLRMQKIEKVEDIEHFLAVFFKTLKGVIIDMVFRGTWNSKTIELNTNYHKFEGEEINGMSEDEYLSNVLGELYDGEPGYTTKDIKECIDKIKNPIHRRLINLLSYNLDMERIRDITGIKKQTNLRGLIHTARKSFFKTLQENGIYEEKEYEQLSNKFTSRKQCFKTTLDELQINREKYLSNDYPFDGKMPEKVLFIIKENAPINKNKILALISLNEIYTTEETTFRPHVTNVMKRLHDEGVIHIDKSDNVFYNGFAKAVWA